MNYRPVSEHRSIWSSGRVTSRYPSLRDSLQVDVAIVGGGITGVTTAAILKREGLRVALITDGQLGQGATGSSTAHVSPIPDMPLKSLLSRFGETSASLVIESLLSARNRIGEFAAQLPADFGYSELPAIKFCDSTDWLEFLEDEEVTARKLGLDCQMLTNAGLPFPTLAAVRFLDHAQLNPLAYIDALAQRIPGDGSYIFEDTHVIEIEDGIPAIVHSHWGRIQAEQVVMCTHCPIGLHLSLQTRVAPYFTYVMAFTAQPAQQSALYWDCSDPYYYLRNLSAARPDLWIVGGCDHKTGQQDAQASFQQLESYIEQRFKNPRYENYWANEIYESVDGLPYIGRIPFSRSLFTATGFAGVGITYGTLSAMINSDLILGRANSYAATYSPLRIKPLASIARFAKENANAVRWFLTDRFGASQETTLDQIPPDEGAVIESQGKKYAVYRDPSGFLHVFSPICRHLGGIVHWNHTEKTWDCPLHGGRYRPTGETFEGPPLHDLQADFLELPISPHPIPPEPTSPDALTDLNLGPA